MSPGTVVLPSYSNTCLTPISISRRKDFSDKAEEKLTPDSQKSLFDKTKEGVTDAGTSHLHIIQPDVLLTSFRRQSRWQRSARCDPSTFLTCSRRRTFTDPSKAMTNPSLRRFPIPQAPSLARRAIWTPPKRPSEMPSSMWKRPLRVRVPFFNLNYVSLILSCGTDAWNKVIESTK